MMSLWEGFRNWLHGDNKPRAEQTRILANHIASAKNDVHYEAKQLRVEASNLEQSLKCLIRNLDRDNANH